MCHVPAASTSSQRNGASKFPQIYQLSVLILIRSLKLELLSVRQGCPRDCAVVRLCIEGDGGAAGKDAAPDTVRAERRVVKRLSQWQIIQRKPRHARRAPATTHVSLVQAFACRHEKFCELRRLRGIRRVAGAACRVRLEDDARGDGAQQHRDPQARKVQRMHAPVLHLRCCNAVDGPSTQPPPEPQTSTPGTRFCSAAIHAGLFAAYSTCVSGASGPGTIRRLPCGLALAQPSIKQPSMNPVSVILRQPAGHSAPTSALLKSHWARPSCIVRATLMQCGG